MLDRIRVSSDLDGSACSWRTVIRLGSVDRSEDTDVSQVGTALAFLGDRRFEADELRVVEPDNYRAPPASRLEGFPIEPIFLAF